MLSAPDGLRQALSTLFLVFDGDTVNPRDSDKLHNGAHAGFQMVHMGQFTTWVKPVTAARRKHNGVARSVGQQGLEGIVKVVGTERHGLVDTHYVVDPGLEVGGHIEVV